MRRTLYVDFLTFHIVWNSKYIDKCVLMRFVWWSLGSRLNSAFLVVGDWSGVSCFNINMARIEQSIVMQGSPWEWNKYLLRDIWVVRSFGAVRHWVHDVFVFNISIIFVITDSIWVEPCVCPMVEHLEGYFFSPFFITFLFNSSTPSFSFLIYSFFFNHT